MLAKPVTHDQRSTWLSPHPLPCNQGCNLHLTDRILTSRKQLISLQNKKLPLCLIVPQHNLPLPAPGPHPHPLPDPIMSPGPLPEVWATFCDLWTRWRQGQNTDCLQASSKYLCGAGHSSLEGQFTGYGAGFATGRHKVTEDIYHQTSKIVIVFSLPCDPGLGLGRQQLWSGHPR